MILTAVIFLCPQHNLHDTDAVSVGLWWYMYIQCTTWGRSYHNFFSQYWQFSNCVSSESLLSLTPLYIKLSNEENKNQLSPDTWSTKTTMNSIYYMVKNTSFFCLVSFQLWKQQQKTQQNIYISLWRHFKSFF